MDESPDVVKEQPCTQWTKKPCAYCGKEFYITCGIDNWAYKIVDYTVPERYRLFCRWNHQMAWEKKHPQKADWRDWLGNERRKRNA